MWRILHTQEVNFPLFYFHCHLRFATIHHHHSTFLRTHPCAHFLYHFCSFFYSLLSFSWYSDFFFSFTFYILCIFVFITFGFTSLSSIMLRLTTFAHIPTHAHRKRALRSQQYKRDFIRQLPLPPLLLSQLTRCTVNFSLSFSFLISIVIQYQKFFRIIPFCPLFYLCALYTYIYK